jgi:hypothetical protein
MINKSGYNYQHTETGDKMMEVNMLVLYTKQNVQSNIIIESHDEA